MLPMGTLHFAMNRGRDGVAVEAAVVAEVEAKSATTVMPETMAMMTVAALAPAQMVASTRTEIARPADAIRI